MPYIPTAAQTATIEPPAQPAAAKPHKPGTKNGRTYKPPAKDGSQRGRPSLPYDPETAERLCEKITEGHGIRELADTDEFPSWPTLRKWLANETDFAIRYARARSASAEALELRALQVAADKSRDPHQSRVEVDTLKWAASKRNPRVYGDKIDLSISGTLQIASSLDTARLSLEELQVLEGLLAKAKRSEPVTIENNRVGDIESPQSDS